MAYYRKLHIADQEWLYHIGRDYVPIKGPNGVSYKPTVAEILGDEYGKWFTGPCGCCERLAEITPGKVKAWLEKVLAC